LSARLRLGTRGSALALAQTQLVRDLLEGAGSGPCEIVPIQTTGDREGSEGGGGAAAASDNAAAASDKSRWVAELEQALLAETIDLAVHSAKDVPGELSGGLELLGAPARASPEDVLCGARSLEALPPGARVGTSSIRRLAQLRAAREDIDVVGVRGNVDTRLRKLSASRRASSPASSAYSASSSAGEGEGEAHPRLDAIVLARAGLQRLGREDEAGGTLDVRRFVPAPGQGVLALEGRAGDARTRELVAAIADGDAVACLRAERALASALEASCHTPLGAHAAPVGRGRLELRAWVGLPDGSEWIADEITGGFENPGALGERVAERLLAVGARELLARSVELAGAGLSR
jgi:hydroxymethylbilane synthase